MPKKPRTPQEIQEAKQHILDKALELINEDGYNNFSMRKLAKKLNMTTTPIYKHYKNKDELYLATLTQGFENLYNIISDAYNSVENPLERLKNVFREYVKFGISNANSYNIMLVLNVPKFYDYVGTSNEPIAFTELEAAIKVREFGKKVVEESGLIKNEQTIDSSMAIIGFFCSIHGFISFINNQIFDYLIEPRVKEMDGEIIDKYIDISILQFKKLFE